MSKKVFKTSEIEEGLQVEINGEMLNFTFRRLNEKETKEIEKEIKALRKREAKTQKLLSRAEKAIKNGKSLEEATAGIEDKNLVRLIEILMELEKLDEIEDGEKIIDLEDESQKIMEKLFDKDSFSMKIYKKQFGGEDKDKVIKFVSSIGEKDRENFYKMLDEWVEESRMGKQKG